MTQKKAGSAAGVAAWFDRGTVFIVHVNYQETKLRIKDGLPKMKDVPKEMGGSGEGVAE